MSDRLFTIFCCIITFVLSLISSFIIRKYGSSKLKKEKKYNEFYKGFHKLWDKIHQGGVLDFSDLDFQDREKILNFLLENYNYASKFLQKLIYNLKINRLDNFENNKHNKIICDIAYRSIIDYMINKEQKYRKKYNNINY